ncbi:uncharacterized protein MYCGRDRAFT_38701 [Zymoseptoria tritici IPO323]|uniref:Uncharacterized protein n=1 Tax=Zymoseptoria tritici (strain CBS 115943 / IPO323) TaxID=336722 RepID=F9X6W7_ZYMTI|nr:uncharacterized protein MYCGRDRAFT_38701 [Zymoseptoria tritici IPO323]EGP88890.1 hypothetical protein MYCGRDRAFT_38701 [Zymoseptoria tritici IPO323]
MGIFSILPAYLSGLETWLARIFLFFSFVIIGPWLLVLLYDLLLYIWRSATYELPYIGGRARGRQRPRAPSLTARPTGHTRQISLPTLPQTHQYSEGDGKTVVSSGRQRSASNTAPRKPTQSYDED